VAPEDLGEAIRGMRAMGFRGANCVHPHKQTAAHHLDRLGRTAELTGLVNCILVEDRQLVGENTEGQALLESVAARVKPGAKHAVLLGAGKVARSVAVELVAAGAGRITVASRTEAHGRDLVHLLEHDLEAAAAFCAWEEDYDLPEGVDVLINTTGIGLGDCQAEARVPLVLDRLTPETLVVDLVCNPPRTRLLREAEQRGCPTLDGLEIFIRQTAINFKMWTGIDADASVLREAVEEFLEI
jgi:shikimate dehydrogenase